MKALSISQPWALLLFTGLKRIETRSWKTSYRGKLAIHATKTMNARAVEIMDMATPKLKALQMFAEFGPRFEKGVILGTVDLIDVFEFTPESVASQRVQAEYEYGNYTLGRYGLLTANPRLFREPVPAKGMLGLWDWNEVTSGP